MPEDLYAICFHCCSLKSTLRQVCTFNINLFELGHLSILQYTPDLNIISLYSIPALHESKKNSLHKL